MKSRQNLITAVTWFTKSSFHVFDTLAYNTTFLFLTIPINFSTSSLNLHFPLCTTGFIYPFFTYSLSVA
ncbi:hypothetical protein MetMK1DRAFT_00033180 [Metallosphaera yellowstonensis MK1]|uniref:Uncharacterized protein n=1 Tax=Metallosphaera yellowstonensis MK1 TaxID=671065 RepID=H2C9P4_9CREN|nr:hypothetical protein MetMK1DRAFT_00033180 [Metallosphaera yellowstonensis MK1]